MVVKNLFIDLKKAYAGKKVLITGHTGFKGSWLALQLRMMGAEVMGFALPPNVQGSHFERLGLIKTVYHVYGDICDRENFTRHFGNICWGNRCEMPAYGIKLLVSSCRQETVL